MELDDHTARLDFIHSGAVDSRPAVCEPIPPSLVSQLDLMQGSGGGLYADLFVDATSSLIVISHQDLNPLRAVLNQIQVAFGLGVSDLSKVACTTRMTVHNWIKGSSEPQPRNLDRLFELSVLASNWIAAGYTDDRAAIRQPVVDGMSIFELLTNEQLDTDLLLFAGSRLAMAKSNRSLPNPFSQ